MFRPEPRIRSLSVPRERVADLVESINQPQIQVPGRDAQAAAGHLCGVRNVNGSLSVYVALHLTATGENVVYVHDPLELTAAAYPGAQREGLAFLESMGFMLDDVQFASLAPELQEQVLRRCPLLAAAPEAPAATTSAEPPSPLARLLSNL